MGNFDFIVTHYFPDPLLYSRPRIAVLVSSYIIGTCLVMPMAFFLAPTRPTEMVDVHAVSVRPAVSSNVTDMFTVHPLGVSLPLSVYRYYVPHVVYCVCLLELLGQGGNGCSEVGDSFALRHRGLSVFRSFRH